MADIYQYIDNNPVQRNTPGIVARVEALEECGCGAITMDAPEVLQEPEALPIGASQTFRFKAPKTGLNETTVDGIVVKIKADAYNYNGEEMLAIDESGIAEWTYTTPSNYSEETVFEITVYAIDSLGNKSKQVVLEKEASLPFIRPPRITAPAANAYVYPIAGFTASTSAFGTFIAEDTHISTDWIITSDADGQVPVAQVLASSDLLSHDFTPTELSNLQTGQTYYLWARHNGETLGAGKLSASISLRSRPAGVKAPEIVTPVANSKIAFAAGVQITAGEFQTVGAEDTHASSDWKLTRDAAGQDVICQVTASSDLTSHTFPASEIGELDEGSTYYAWVRYNGTVLGNGIWASVAWEAMLGIVTPSGRIMYRHSSELGTVIEYERFGYKESMVVLDAAYRTAAKFGTYGTDSPLANFNNTNKNSTWYISGGGPLDNKPNAPVMTDAQLQAMWPSLSTDKTARENCNEWIKYKGQSIGSASYMVVGVPAVEHCRNLTSLFSGGCDLPNEYQLMILYLESDAIDALDPTAQANPDNKIGKTHGNGRFCCAGVGSAWSSTEYGPNYVLRVHNNGDCSGTHKNTEFSVLPIRELSRRWGGFLDDGVTLKSGRKLYRHENGMGSVLEYVNYQGETKHLFVADAAYRTAEKFGTYGKDSSLANFDQRNENATWYIDGSDTNLNNKANAPVMTDAQFQTMWWPSLSTDKTARQNCDVWMTYEGTTDSKSISGVPAVKHCRSLTSLFSGGCDLPNEYQLMILYLESDAIDALDPTAEANPNNKIGKTHASGRFYFAGANSAWSSTEYSSNYVRAVNYFGYCTNNLKSTSYSVLPVRELDSSLQPIM